MNPLLVNSDDGTGGAARAALRLHHGLLTSGISSRLLVQKKTSGLDTVLGPGDWSAPWYPWIRARLDELPVCAYRRRTRSPFSVAGLPGGFLGRLSATGADIVHLHWICGGFVSLAQLARIHLPLVWTLHDSWPFTGGCHLPGDCRNYQRQCGNCPVLGSQRENDLSRRGWQRKHNSFGKLNLTFISPSHWLAEKARASALLAGKTIEVIPNAVDCQQFLPLDQIAARRRFDLPLQRKIILFGAKNILGDSNKGLDLLWQALGQLPAEIRNQCTLVIVGCGASTFSSPVEIDCRFYGEITEENRMVDFYRAADLFVMTSRQENLPNMISEAMACGLPCAAFAVGGVPEQITHRQTGCLAPPYDTEKLAAAIGWSLTETNALVKMSQCAREHALTRFSLDSVAAQHLQIYRRLLPDSAAGKSRS